MYRIDDPTADASDPAKPIYTEGNPGTGTPATIVRAAALNQIQEELAYLVEQGGGTLSAADTTQVYTKIAAMIAAGAGNYVAKAGGTMTGALNMSGAPINESVGGDIASSATPDIAGATGNSLNMTGSVSVTGFTAGTSGMRRLVRFTDAAPPLLTHSGTLLLPGSTNLQPSQFDQVEFYCYGGTTWGVIRVAKVNGTSARARVASTTVSGEIEISTDAEAKAKTATDRALVPSNLAALRAVGGTTVLSTLSNNSVVSFTHGLTAPVRWGAYMLCNTADGGFSVGDKVDFATCAQSTGVATWYSLKENGTDVSIVYNNQTSAPHLKIGGSDITVSVAKWSIVLWASLV